MRRMIASALWCAAIAAGAQNVGFTPRADAKEIPSYELVSIHKTTDAHPEPGTRDTPDGFTATAQSLSSLISEAYSFSLGPLSEHQLIGAPTWANSQLYDVRAKVDAGNVERVKALEKSETMAVTVRNLVSRTPAFRMLMLQRLLEDRFHLKVHYEQRTMSLYQMTPAKGGLRMNAAHPADPESGSFSMSDGKLEGENVPMAFVPMALALALERPVEDRTGVAGNYDFHLSWARAESGASAGVDEVAPSLFTAVQEQMGLKLKPGRGPVWVVVVDHAETPTEN